MRTTRPARIAALTGLALAEAAAGDVEAGLRHGDGAVELCRQIGDRHLEGAVENHLADLLHAAGRDDEAMVHLRRAVEAFAEVGGDPAELGSRDLDAVGVLAAVSGRQPRRRTAGRAEARGPATCR